MNHTGNGSQGQYNLSSVILENNIYLSKSLLYKKTKNLKYFIYIYKPRIIYYYWISVCTKLQSLNNRYQEQRLKNISWYLIKCKMLQITRDFPDSSAGKESACNVGDSDSVIG